MELTIKNLIENGFETNHPERALPRYYKKNSAPHWFVSVTPHIDGSTNQMLFNVECVLYTETGAVRKSATISNITTIEELNTICLATDICL